MNGLAEEMARRNGLLTFRQACDRYETTKDKLRSLISAGLLTCRTSELDRRAKLLSIQELDALLGGRQEDPSADQRKVA
jgi:hypothetical protein